MYHCVFRTVNKEFIIDRAAKEVLRKQLWQIADFSGVEVIAYCIMSSHFHVLVRVPDKETARVTEQELMRRYRVFYPKPTRYQEADLMVLEKKRLENDEKAERVRRRLPGRMHDISEFMETRKERFSIWYNRTHDREGTLWSERYKSTLVEGIGPALRITAAYIDLNPVRAKVVDDPKEYRWSGYAERIFEEFRSQFGPKRKSGPRPMRGSDREGLMMMRDLRKEVFG